MSGGSTRSGPGAGKAGGGDVMAGGAAGLVDASGAVYLATQHLGGAGPALGCWRAVAVLGCGHTAATEPQVRGSAGGAGCGWCAALIAGVRKDTADASFPPSTSHTHCLFVASTL